MDNIELLDKLIIDVKKRKIKIFFILLNKKFKECLKNKKYFRVGRVFDVIFIYC